MNLRGTHASPSALNWTKQESLPPTPTEWLAMLPDVVAQVPPERHEEFVLSILRALEAHKIDMASCVIDEMAGWWR